MENLCFMQITTSRMYPKCNRRGNWGRKKSHIDLQKINAFPSGHIYLPYSCPTPTVPSVILPYPIRRIDLLLHPSQLRVVRRVRVQLQIY